MWFFSGILRRAIKTCILKYFSILKHVFVSWTIFEPFLVPPKMPKMGHFGCFWLFLGCTWGAQIKIKILRPLFNTIPPLKHQLDTLGTILDPGKVIFGHFFYFGHFPIEIPIEAKKIYGQQKEESYIKNKSCFENQRPNGTTWNHVEIKIPNFVKIRITLPI